MENEIEIKEAQHEVDFLAARQLILEYAQWLVTDQDEKMKATLSAQNFDKEMDTLPEAYGKLDGRLFIALRNDKAIGVAGIKRFNDKECEVKRMFVRPEGRGLGIGKRLLEKCIETAKSLKYNCIKLDTADFMKAAIKLYTDHGFVEIAAYRFNPHDQARYFELELTSKQT